MRPNGFDLAALALVAGATAFGMLAGPLPDPMTVRWTVGASLEPTAAGTLPRTVALVLLPALAGCLYAIGRAVDRLAAEGLNGVRRYYRLALLGVVAVVVASHLLVIALNSGTAPP